MRGRAFFGSSKLMPTGAVIGATFSPGWVANPSEWRLVIDDEGNLFQAINLLRWTLRGRFQQERQEHIKIGQDAVLQLLLKSQEIGFLSLRDSYQAEMTDQESYTLAIRFGEIDKIIRVYGAHCLAYEGNTDMTRFLELWKAIHQFAPFPRK